ncbi:hypothetical protein FA13DRAFT_1705277 [Coprinellus micaceus]|uniref:Uncharacterized protein n=1 Tax=Coprinellus micaceus TaxID=71717 RepID=A0A4Y7TVY0_COPMI|nr:hypothetical protein FA13DRAFT_1705277 [Coprinellus micaceus]
MDVDADATPCTTYNSHGWLGWLVLIFAGQLRHPLIRTRRVSVHIPLDCRFVPGAARTKNTLATATPRPLHIDHVEELRKEMGKEVFVMAQEVERLHRDKQEVEQRIAELMAFYSKQSTLAAGSRERLKSGFESMGSHAHTPPGMLALSSEPTYVHSTVEKYFDLEKHEVSGDPSNPAGPGNHGHYLQAPSSSLDSRLQQYNSSR